MTAKPSSSSAYPGKPSERDALLGGAPGGVAAATDELLLHAHRDEPYWRRLLSVVQEIVPLSLFSFGGPPSHLALAHDRFVRTKKWLSDERFLEVLSIASAIPGPSSTQVVTAMGLFRAGPLGGLVALFFWMLPSFVVLTAAGVGAQTYLKDGLPEWMRGLAPAAVSLVVIAAVRLWQKAVGDDLLKAFVAAVSSCVVLATQGLSTLVFPLVMVLGGAVILAGHVAGFAPVHVAPDRHASHNLQRQIGISPLGGALILLVWFAVLLALAVFHPQDAAHKTPLSMFYALYWIGSIIFGGGQVMLPMLLTNFVDLGWVSKEQFLVGFALVQSLPGPMFNISAYLGAVVYGPAGALVGAAGLFGPGITLFFGLLPLWEKVREHHNLKIFLAGVNAAACGLIVASIFLLWEKAVHSNADAAIGLATGLMVGVFSVPSPVAIIVGAILAYLLTPGLLNVGQANFCGPQGTAN